MSEIRNWASKKNMTTLSSLRPPEGFNIIFPELAENITDDEFARWRTEINLIWAGYDVEWSRHGDRVWGIKCTLRTPLKPSMEPEDDKTNGEFGFGPN